MICSFMFGSRKPPVGRLFRLEILKLNLMIETVLSHLKMNKVFILVKKMRKYLLIHLVYMILWKKMKNDDGANKEKVGFNNWEWQRMFG